MTVQAIDETTWLTANVRPAGRLGRDDVDRLRALLDALSASASMIVLDLAATSLRAAGAVGAAGAIDDAAAQLEARGGCLLCVNADDDTCARLSGCRHAVVVGQGAPRPVGAPA
ncbi:hypothetical protein [Cellulomonas alba]|uniref:STAS domain-containing protein n=1 Tax=Cellulomonas alba TaxID=3053467 RepID=A0ABT7SGH0_9CELL|nr:hypothetical protein [Cellulomonas alba]MDM7855276.1 hypothetical protein [Cellulomonas alba]